MGIIGEALDFMLPRRIQRREESRRDVILTRYMEAEIGAMDRMGTGLGEGMVVDESVQRLGEPWQLQAAGLTRDLAFRQGFPNIMGAFDAGKIAHDDTLRGYILDLSRHL